MKKLKEIWKDLSFVPTKYVKLDIFISTGIAKIKLGEWNLIRPSFQCSDMSNRKQLPIEFYS